MGDGVEDAERHAEAEQEADAAAEDELVAEKALVIREERETLPAPASVLPSSREWEATMAVAREIAGTQFVPESYRGKPDAVVAAILTGREMGIGPMQALRRAASSAATSACGSTVRRLPRGLDEDGGCPVSVAHEEVVDVAPHRSRHQRLVLGVANGQVHDDAFLVGDPAAPVRLRIDVRRDAPVETAGRQPS